MLGGVQNPAALTMHHMVSSGATLALTTKAGDYFLPVTLSGSPSVRLPVTRCNRVLSTELPIPTLQGDAIFASLSISSSDLCPTLLHGRSGAWPLTLIVRSCQ